MGVCNTVLVWFIVNRFKLSIKTAVIRLYVDAVVIFLTRKDFFLAHTGTLRNREIYRKVSNISRTLVGNQIVDHPDIVGASSVGAAPTTSSFST